jgi:hypothetical protein
VAAGAAAVRRVDGAVGGGIWAPGNAVLQAAADSKVAGLKAAGLGCRAAGERPLPRPAA